MTNISIYDDTADKLDEISEENYTSIPEIIEGLVEAIRNGDIILSDYI